MKNRLDGLLMAFSTYSAIPMPRVQWSKENMHHTICFFPLVGLVVGGAIWGWLWLCQLFLMGAVLTGAGAVVLPLLITGGIHMDGFCDTIDARASHAPTARKLEILKDPHIGAFALIGCCVLLVVSFGLWTEFSFSPYAAGVLALGFVVSRCFSGLSVVCFRKAKQDGIVRAFADAASQQAATWLCLLAVLSGGGMLLLSPLLGGACLLVTSAVWLWYRRMAYRLFGGVTGDLSGYFLQLCELGMLAAVVVVQVIIRIL